MNNNDIATYFYTDTGTLFSFDLSMKQKKNNLKLNLKIT